MVYRSFDQLISIVKGHVKETRMAVAAAGDIHTVEAALIAKGEGIARPIFVGDKAVIDEALAHLGA